ncbi:hypothetical protein OG21DRAFT_1523204 [Imleria badia]|nr:hypothetical protein OG21DRAFT_1523204 [Imleria badia]
MSENPTVVEYSRHHAWLPLFIKEKVTAANAQKDRITLSIGAEPLHHPSVYVSTCQLTVHEDDKVCAGQELGMFRIGGSGYAVVVGPQVKITFEDVDGKPIEPNTHYWVGKICEDMFGDG